MDAGRVRWDGVLKNGRLRMVINSEENIERSEVNRIKWIIATCLRGIPILTLMSLVCAICPELPIGETIGQWVWFGKSISYSFCCIVIASLLLLLRTKDRNDIFCFRYFNVYVSWSLVLLGGIEAVWGLCQLYGFSISGHSRYAFTGSFFNPGPYAGYLAMVLPLCLHLYLDINGWKEVSIRYKMEKGAVAVAGLLILCVLPATMSRSAWVAAAISCTWVIYMHRDKRKWNMLWHRYKKRYILWGMGAFLILSLAVAGIFLLKQDSALGRLFMWKITCKAIVNHPWGCQKGFAFAYGEAQSLYFAPGGYAGWEKRVAGSPEYAFNEYLEFALAHGIVMCIIVLLVILGCLLMGVKLKRYGICGAIISLLIFSFSSYPMHLPAFIVAGVCLLLACGIGDVIGKLLILCMCLIVWIGGYTEKWTQERNACCEWMNARILYRSGAYEPANKAYKELYPYLKEKGAFLFEYGHSLHKSGHYDESFGCLDRARLYSNDPMILNIMGKNCQALHEYKCAEAFFLISVSRLPGRIYPYYLLAKLYSEPAYRDKDKFMDMKWNVLNKEPKVHSTAIEEMRREVEEIARNWDAGDSIK